MTQPFEPTAEDMARDLAEDVRLCKSLGPTGWTQMLGPKSPFDGLGPLYTVIYDREGNHLMTLWDDDDGGEEVRADFIIAALTAVPVAARRALWAEAKLASLRAAIATLPEQYQAHIANLLVPCPRCDGTGQVFSRPDGDICHACERCGQSDG